MSRIFWDTNLFIYLIEDKGPLAVQVVALRQRMLERGDHLFTSSLTLGEVLVRPKELNNEELAAEYDQAISAGATVLAFGDAAARRYAAIRKDRAIKPPDAIQLACAAEAEIDLFITNDDRLSKKVVPGIQFVSSLKNAPI